MDGFAHWHEFYVLLGTAAATLLALLFVAVSLGAGFLSARHAEPTRVFFSPCRCWCWCRTTMSNSLPG
jgi:hypothetical protein